MSGALPFLAGHLWPALATALALGILIGVTSCGGRTHRAVTLPSGLLWLSVAAGGLAVAELGWIPGRYGLWFEMAAFLAAAYVIGCALGCGLRALVRRDRGAHETPNSPA